MLAVLQLLVAEPHTPADPKRYEQLQALQATSEAQEPNLSQLFA